MKGIKNYEKKYSVSEDGKIFSLDYRRTGEVRELSPIKNKQGYHRVNLFKDGKVKMFYVHRLVAEAFLDDWNADLDVDHIDMNKANNHVSNLRMTTRSQNKQNNNAKGVCFSKRDNKWFAKLQINYRQYHGPYRDTKKEALADRQELIQEHGTL